MITGNLKDKIGSLPKIKSKKSSTVVLDKLLPEITFANHLQVLEQLLYKVKLLNRKAWFIEEFQNVLSSKGVPVDKNVIAMRKQSLLEYKQLKKEEFKEINQLRKAFKKQKTDMAGKVLAKKQKKSIKTRMKNLNTHKKGYTVSGAYGSPGNHFKTISVSPKS